jgi:hypothetical protein
MNCCATTAVLVVLRYSTSVVRLGPVCSGRVSVESGRVRLGPVGSGWVSVASKGDSGGALNVRDFKFLVARSTPFFS